MSIATALKFARGAVSKKEFVPALTHFQIAHGRVTGYNGSLSLSAPIDLDIDCCPKAAPFANAVEACEETAQLHLTPAGKLSIRSGKFRALLDCLPLEAFPVVMPEGQPVAIDGELLPALRRLYDFTAEDASRPWAAGILLDGGSAYASNNIVLIEYWLGYHFPFRVNVPRATIQEMLRIGEEPVGLQLTGNSATFHYEGDRWLRTQLNSIEWPDVAGLLDRATGSEDAPLVPEDLFTALETLTPFVGDTGQLYFSSGLLCTSLDGEGASVEIGDVPDCSYNVKMLKLLQPVAERIDFAAYPSPVPFYGERLRGFIAGMR